MKKVSESGKDKDVVLRLVRKHKKISISDLLKRADHLVSEEEKQTSSAEGVDVVKAAIWYLHSQGLIGATPSFEFYPLPEAQTA